MAWYMQRAHEESGERPVVFLHVPDLPSEVLVAQGREVAVGLVKALVASKVKVGAVEPLKAGYGRGSGQMSRNEEMEGWSGISDVKP